MTSKTFRARIVREGSMCCIPLTFDPKVVFGRVRAPVKVTLNGYTFRSTVAAMGGPPCVPLRKSNREAAGLEGGETIEVRLELDTETRDVTPPADLLRALKATPGAMDRWRELSYTHKREHVEAIDGARKPETRARRIENAIRMIIPLVLAMIVVFTPPAHAQSAATGIAKDAARESKTARLSVEALCALLTLDEVTAIMGKNFERRPDSEQLFKECKYGDSQDKQRVRYFSLGSSVVSEANWRKMVVSGGKGKVI